MLERAIPFTARDMGFVRSLRESKRASIGLVGCPHEAGKLGIEACRILPERSMADVVGQAWHLQFLQPERQ